MTTTIWKYPLKTVDQQVVEMPANAQVLTLQMQHGSPHIWAWVDSAAPKRKRLFITVGTGRPLPPFAATSVYRGTYQLDGGALVLHVFEVPWDIEP